MMQQSSRVALWRHILKRIDGTDGFRLKRPAGGATCPVHQRKGLRLKAPHPVGHGTEEKSSNRWANCK